MRKRYLSILTCVLICCFAGAQTVWTGPVITFTKAALADPTSATSQDRITDNVWLTRGNVQGLFNIKTESFYTGTSPKDTEWATGTIANYQGLTYTSWFTWYGKNPTGIIGEDAVVHLISENIYIGIKFLSWGQGEAAGGSFSYERTSSSTLPVTLKSFTAFTNNNNAVIEWKTASEINNKYFTVEYSADGRNFTPVGKVDAANGSGTEHAYSFTHTRLSEGNHYYRLSQHDFDETVKYSKVLLVTLKLRESLQVTPNPATSFIRIKSLPQYNGATYTIGSAAGQIVKKGIISSGDIDGQSLVPGHYWLFLKTGAGQVVKAPFLKK